MTRFSQGGISSLSRWYPPCIPPSYEEHCSGFFAGLDDKESRFSQTHFRVRRFPSSCFLVHLHGAVTRVPVAATPFPLRRDGIACDVATYWKSPDGHRIASEWIEALKRNCLWTKTATT